MTLQSRLLEALQTVLPSEIQKGWQLHMLLGAVQRLRSCMLVSSVSSPRGKDGYSESRCAPLLEGGSVGVLAAPWSRSPAALLL